MELSALPKDVLELGRLLVSEFLGERDNDTLSRWFLHAIAERLLRVEQAKTGPQRKIAEDDASDLILRFWRHRKATNIGADPLSRYDKLFEALQQLLPTANPWTMNQAAETERLAANLFDCLSKLTTGLMLLGVSATQLPADKRLVLAQFLPTNEAAILRHFEYVEGLIREEAKEKQATNTSTEATHQLAAGDYIAIVQRLTKQARETLARVDVALATAQPGLQSQIRAARSSGMGTPRRDRKRPQTKGSAQPKGKGRK
jgi:hypothetical protein